MLCVSIKSEELKTRILSSSVLIHVGNVTCSSQTGIQTSFKSLKCWIPRWYQKLHVNLKCELEIQRLGF